MATTSFVTRLLMLGLFVFGACTHSPRATRGPASAGPIAYESPKAPEDGDEKVLLPQGAADGKGDQTCAYTGLLASLVETYSDAEIREAFTAEIEIAGGKSKPSKAERRALKDLEAVRDSANPRQALTAMLADACDAKRTLGGGWVRTGKLAASTVVSGITLPIRFVAKFGIGVWSRRVTEERGPSYGELLGSRVLGPLAWATNLYRASRVLVFSGNPWLFSAMVLGTIDLHAGMQCRSKDPKTVGAEKFCRDYLALKKGEFKITEVGEKVGVQIGERMVRTFDFRGDSRANRALCEAGPKKQVRVGRRAMERLHLRLRDTGEKDYTLELVTPEEDGCASIKIRMKDEASLARVSARFSGLIDGMPYRMVVASEDDERISSEIRERGPELPATTDQELCRKIVRTQFTDADFKVVRRQARMQSYEVLLNPERFAEFDWTEYATPPGAFRPQNGGTGARNVILILAPSEAQKAEYAALAPQIASLHSELKRQKGRLERLKKSKDYSACLRAQDEVGFDPARFDAVTKAISSHAVVKIVEEFRSMHKQAGKAGRRLFGLYRNLKLDWEIDELTDLNLLRERLADPTVGNVVVVSHGYGPNAKIVDAELNALPAWALEAASPALRSVSFFSCHSEEALRTYELERVFADLPTREPVRYGAFVDSHAFYSEQNSVPIAALAQFIEALDRKLDGVRSGSSRAARVLAPLASSPTEDSVSCSAQIRYPAIAEGGFAVKLNGHWLGTLYSHQGGESPAFRFPCRWLQGSNELMIDNQNLRVNTTLPECRAELSVSGIGRAPVNGLAITQCFTRADGSVKSAKWSF